jgi:flagellar hook-associated protein 1 FlgK
LTTSDYRLRVTDDGDFQLVRLSNNQVVDTLDPNDGNTLEADGLVVDINELGDAEPGDNWLIQPTRNGARDLDVVLDDPSGIAAAGASLQASAAEGNNGDATIQGVQVTGDAFDPAVLDEPITVTVVEDGGELFYEVNGEQFSVNDDGPTVIELDGWELTLQGAPEEGDEFVVELDRDRPGDNRNMLEMADLSEARTIETDNGDRRVPGFGDAYNSLIANVGTRTRQANVALDSANAQLEQAKAQRESISGVNLDEEAADLIRYQQAYQAAAQVIQVSNSLFDSLLGAFRR